MELPLGNPYKDLLNLKLEGHITKKQLDTEIAKRVSNNPKVYEFEPTPRTPQSLVSYQELPDDKKEKVWRDLQYHPEILKYNRILAEHTRNKYWLKYYIDCLEDFPDEQYRLKQRLALYSEREVLSPEALGTVSMFEGRIV